MKWALFFGLLLLLVVFVVGGRMHAMKRINKGLKPLGYHRVGIFDYLLLNYTDFSQWMLSRRQRALYDPSYRPAHIYYTTHPPPQNAQYGMYPMPPPMYDPTSAPPPTYQPQGGSKIDPSQARPETEGSSSAPQPPPAVQPNHTGASNNPYRA